MLNEARRDFSDVLEQIGSACMHLREASDFAESNLIPTAVTSVEDAQEMIDDALRELTKIRDKAGRWAVWAEGKEGA
jgi:hypothetical protein